ncbi:MAG: Calx-beta domain-containing protein [Flavobacteriaceae bacterium]
MNNFIYSLLILLTITSCTDDEGVNFQADTFYLYTANTVVNENDGAIDVTFNTSKTYNSDTVINFALSGTADDTTDYIIPSTNVTILAGETSATTTISLVDDTLIEDQEDIIITVTSTSNSDIFIDESDTINITIIDDESTAYQDGILISNYGNPTSSLTYISDDFNTIEQQIYNTVNGEDVGDGLQSVGFNNDKAYLITTTNHKITVVNRNSFFKNAEITTGLNNPRYFSAYGTTGYVTNWGDPMVTTDDFIAVIDLETNTVSSSIAVDEKPEKIITKNGKLYILHSGDTPNLTIIDATDDSVSTVALNGVLLNDFVFDNTNSLWILSEGDAVTTGKLIQFNTSDESTVELDFATGEHPQNLSYHDGSLYYALNDSIYTLLQTDTALPTTSIITTPVYKLAVNNDKVYVTNDPDSVSNGTLKVFDLTDHSELQSVPTGIIPGGIYFN